MFKFSFKTIQKKILADNTTPVELYLKLRDRFPKTLLLEISDYKIHKNYSILCVNPISEFIVDKNVVRISYPNFVHKHIFINEKSNIQVLIDDFFAKFKSENSSISYSGFYGYVSYDSIQYFEKIKLYAPIKEYYDLPQIRFGFYGNLIIFHPLYNEIYLIEHKFSNLENKLPVNQLIDLIKKKNISFFSFKSLEKITSNISDKEYKNMVKEGIDACFRGDVFQIVLSRQFQQKFKGDEFNVYRALRFINPSPYLFYFDYGNYKIFGSSPESQLIIENKTAYLYPIAGTIGRSGDKKKDIESSKILSKDPKENAEHVMLVDLARNDLSKNASHVKVENFKNIQSFSHVLHMVSKVSGKLGEKTSIIKVFGDTFPAGTLSGAPKYKAMKLIDQIENQNRGIYGGAIGFFGLKNYNINTAIVIRSFISKNNILFFQAGAGVVSYSNREKELEEVNNKLMALFNAIDYSQNI
ncbi:anthranilate synthase component I family protein [Blattabacterium cuenoti]|uniref:anthranilate synthase component I family protein n=1 Tax=Blattabacterium cuenoti TaxID=1653831 RepID=UPI00163D36C4|nr:anthranilate synthase component I family protein [Blattabacterium cuenoti]